MIDFCVEREAGTLFVSDCFNMTKNAKGKKSKRSNQENSGNPIGQLFDYLQYKGELKGVNTVTKINESYTTQSCPKCSHRYKPSGRTYKCKSSECDFVGVRDEVGGANILNKAVNNGTMQSNCIVPNGDINYLRPVQLKRNVVDRMRRGKLSDTTLILVPASEDAA
jgi:putative transposase